MHVTNHPPTPVARVAGRT